MKIKALLLTLVVVFMMICNTGCKNNREYDEAEVVLAAELLIKKSEILNEIYYGNGIAYDADISKAEGYYYPADPVHTYKLGVSTVEELKTLTRECFSESFANSIINTKLSSIMDEEGIQSYARYYQKYNALDDTEECIMVYKNAVVYLIDTVVYDYTTIKVSGVEGDEVFVKITATVTNSEGKSQTVEKEISLIEEEDGWRINSPTYIRYVNDDYYKDLQN